MFTFFFIYISKCFKCCVFSLFQSYCERSVTLSHVNCQQTIECQRSHIIYIPLSVREGDKLHFSLNQSGSNFFYCFHQFNAELKICIIAQIFIQQFCILLCKFYAFSLSHKMSTDLDINLNFVKKTCCLSRALFWFLCSLTTRTHFKNEMKLYFFFFSLKL